MYEAIPKIFVGKKAYIIEFVQEIMQMFCMDLENLKALRPVYACMVQTIMGIHITMHVIPYM